MPVLMIALFALACFGVIGVLLSAALICERKNKPTADKSQSRKKAA